MRRLTLLRHGRAEWPAGQYRDYDRPLDSIGLEQARQAAQRLAEDPSPPTLIVCSTAQRTAQTAAAVSQALAGRRVPQKEDRRFYMASLESLLQVIGELGGQATHLLVVGHNPSLSELAQRLLRSHSGLGTGELLTVELPLDDWRSL